MKDVYQENVKQRKGIWLKLKLVNADQE